MAAGFRRLLASLTGPKVSPYLGHKQLSCSCSANLPNRSHPVVAGLLGSVNAVVGWTQAPVPAQAACTAWIGAGMEHLDHLLSGLTDLLHDPQVQDPELQRCNTASSWTERLLHDLVVIADAHSCFLEVLLSLKQLLADAQSAVRHRDTARLAAALSARCNSDRALSRIADTLRAASHHSICTAAATSDSAEAALAEAVAIATCAAATASAAIFAALASASSPSALRALTSPTAASPAKALERLRSLEDSVVSAEEGCERVHRALVNTRMSLLNALMPC